MTALLAVLFLTGMIEPKPSTPPIEHSAPTASSRRTSVVVVADGSRSWRRTEADAIIDQLRSELDTKWFMHVARFDAETPQDEGLIVAGSNRDLVQIRSNTPMKEAIVRTLDGLAVRDSVSAMVVIAHAQSSPTYVRTDGLIESLSRSHIPVYTIHLSGRQNRPGVFRRLGHAVTAGVVWMVECLIEEDREAESAKATARTLKSISDKTGGVSCVVSDREGALSCADSIATRITESFNLGVSGR